jgi:hypothetical protein
MRNGPSAVMLPHKVIGPFAFFLFNRPWGRPVPVLTFELILDADDSSFKQMILVALNEKSG